MKAVFISYNQAYGDEIVDILDRQGQRGFTRFDGVSGRGSKDGIPHFNNHAWPEYNDAILVMVEDEKVPELLESVKKLDMRNEEVGVRAFVWNVEATV
jgi:nitrogen regulatory protein PII